MATAVAIDPKLMTPITSCIDPNGRDCQNEDTEHPLAHGLQPNEDLYLGSDPDVDEQLILRFQFTQPVNLSGIVMKGPEGGFAPRTIKVFTNKLNLGFDDASDAVPVEEIVQSEEGATQGAPNPVRFVKFQNIQSLQLFVQDNFGESVTKITKLELFGTMAQKMNMSEFKPVKG